MTIHFIQFPIFKRIKRHFQFFVFVKYAIKPRELKVLPRLKQKVIKQTLEVQDTQYAHFDKDLKTEVRILRQFFVIVIGNVLCFKKL